MNIIYFLLLLLFASGVSAAENSNLTLRCPMKDIDLVGVFKIDFTNNSLVYSMEGLESSQEYFFTIEDDTIFVPPSEFGEERINLTNYVLSSKPGYSDDWKSYQCVKQD